MTFKTIQTILSEVYDAGISIFDPTPILWAAERAIEEIGVEAAKRELSAINTVRERRGIPVAVPAFGHVLFA